jgi:hypothetical protein
MITYSTTPTFKNVNRLFTVEDSFAPNACATEIRKNLEKCYLTNTMKLIYKGLFIKQPN